MSSEKNDHDTHYHELSGTEAHEKVTELVKGIHICMMTTAGEDGTMSSRPMAVQNKPFDGRCGFLRAILRGRWARLRGTRMFR